MLHAGDDLPRRVDQSDRVISAHSDVPFGHESKSATGDLLVCCLVFIG